MEKKNVQRILFLLISFIVLAFLFKEPWGKNKEAETKTRKCAVTEMSDIQKEPSKFFAGDFVLTAYCSCYECCEEWAVGRPVDENGEEIVYGASGERLKQGVSIAVDPSVIPYGTRVEIDGKIYIAQDCGGAISGNRIDVYHDSHQDALNFGVQTKPVYIIRG